MDNCQTKVSLPSRKGKVRREGVVVRERKKTRFVWSGRGASVQPRTPPGPARPTRAPSQALPCLCRLEKPRRGRRRRGGVQGSSSPPTPPRASQAPASQPSCRAACPEVVPGGRGGPWTEGNTPGGCDIRPLCTLGPREMQRFSKWGSRTGSHRSSAQAHPRPPGAGGPSVLGDPNAASV